MKQGFPSEIGGNWSHSWWFPLGRGAHLVGEKGGAQAPPAAGAGSGDGQDNWKPFVLGKPGFWISEADKTNEMTEEGFSV